jgi:8-hydroxy-5-deazaflavin:NADPH oxidoreductase
MILGVGSGVRFLFMTTAVLGTGNIGGTIGRAFARAGIPTVFGSRHPDTSDIAGDSGARVSSIDAALGEADVVLLAVPAGAVDEILRTHGSALSGKLVIDAANNVGGAVANFAPQVAELAPGARYARAFNTLGWENFANPDFDGIKADLYYSGPAADRSTLERHIEAVGLRPMYVGEGQQDTVDAVLRLWFALAIGQKHGRNLAFRTLTR